MHLACHEAYIIIILIAVVIVNAALSNHNPYCYLNG